MARKKNPDVELKDQRIPIMMSPSELEAVDTWSFEHRIRSRGEAIRRLCEIGIAFERLGTRSFDTLINSSNQLLTTDEFEEKSKEPGADPVSIFQDNNKLVFDTITATLIELGPAIVTSLAMKRPGEIREKLERMREIRQRFENSKDEIQLTLAELMDFLAEAAGLKVDQYGNEIGG